MSLINHTSRMIGRLILQYKDAENLQAIISAIGNELEELEQVNSDLLNLRSIYTATNAQLDGWGEILDVPRAGRTDDEYRARLFIKIAEITSEGTAEDLIQLYLNLMDADWIEFHDYYPAAFHMLAKNGSPIGDTTDIRNAITAAKAAGVEYELFVSTSPAFAFLADPDPDTDGFSSLAAPTTGGILSEILT